MIPELEELNISGELEEESYADLTYYVDRENKKIIGLTEGYEAAKQALYLILSTERYKYVIYDLEYGLYVKDLIGQPANYVYSELKRRITEAVLKDERFTSVGDFEFTRGGKRDSLVLRFKVGSDFEKEIKAAYEISPKGGEASV